MTEEQVMDKAAEISEFSGVTFIVRRYGEQYRLTCHHMSINITVCVGTLEEIYTKLVNIKSAVV